MWFAIIIQFSSRQRKINGFVGLEKETNTGIHVINER
jgi:hypothetical protein